MIRDGKPNGPLAFTPVWLTDLCLYSNRDFWCGFKKRMICVLLDVLGVQTW